MALPPTWQTVILAAGQGKRMHSNLPKVLHRLAGKPLLEHVVQTVHQLNPTQQPIIIYGHQGDTVRHALAHLNANWVEQAEQLGTGHAVQQALPQLPKQGHVLVLCGDVPLISKTTLKKLIEHTPANTLGMITANLSNPTGLGRIIRNAQNQIIRIVEERDATETECTIS
jgi:bifunctional UDP-N-acetylglucosamine pyrophosphorylase/glucosamine-1-phosphate N-acetyltransferase